MLVTACMTFGCFVLANIFSTLMVQAEARNRAVMAGTFEGVFALFWIVAARYSIIALGYKNIWDIAIILVVLFAGNFVGAWMGVKVGERYITDEDDEALDNRIHELEDEIDRHHELEGDENPCE